MCGITQFVEIIYRNTQIRSKYLEKMAIGLWVSTTKLILTAEEGARNVIRVTFEDDIRRHPLNIKP